MMTTMTVMIDIHLRSRGEKGRAEQQNSRRDTVSDLLLLGLGLGLQAADLLLGQRRRVLLLLGRSQPELQVGHLPLQLHDPGALRHRGHLRKT